MADDDIKTRHPSKKKEIIFERAPYAVEIFDEKGSEKFNSLVAWQRQIVKGLVQHGDLKKAAKDAGASKEFNKAIDLRLASQLTIRDSLLAGGIDSDYIVEHLKTCIESKNKVLDKHGNLVETDNLNIKLKAIEMAAKLLGSFEEKVVPKVSEDMFANVKLEDD